MDPTSQGSSQPRPKPPRHKIPDNVHSALVEQLLGSCKDLWESDEEFEEFLATIEATRKEKG